MYDAINQECNTISVSYEACEIPASVMIFATRRAPWAQWGAELSHCINPVCAQNGAFIFPGFPRDFMNELDHVTPINNPSPTRASSDIAPPFRETCAVIGA